MRLGDLCGRETNCELVAAVLMLGGNHCWAQITSAFGFWSQASGQGSKYDHVLSSSIFIANIIAITKGSSK